MVLNIENHKLYKKCNTIFKLEVLHMENSQDKIYENLKHIVEWFSLYFFILARIRIKP